MAFRVCAYRMAFRVGQTSQPDPEGRDASEHHSSRVARRRVLDSAAIEPPSVSRFTEGDRGIGASPVSSSSSLPRSGIMQGGARGAHPLAPSKSADLALSAVNAGSSAPAAREAQFLVGQAKVRRAEVRAVLEHQASAPPRHRRRTASGAPAGGRTVAERGPSAGARFRGQQGRDHPTERHSVACGGGGGGAAGTAGQGAQSGGGGEETARSL